MGAGNTDAETPNDTQAHPETPRDMAPDLRIPAAPGSQHIQAEKMTKREDLTRRCVQQRVLIK